MRNIFLAVLTICLIATLAHAERKSSFLGSVINKTKEGVGAIKQDVRNYRTHVVKIKVVNRTNNEQHIELWEPFSSNPNECKVVFERTVRPWSTNDFTVEIIPNQKKGKLYSLQAKGGNNTKPYDFDPTKEDNVVFEVR